MLQQDQTVLVVVDVQGKLAHIMTDKERLFERVAIAIQGAQLLDVPILWLEQVPDKLGATVPELAALLADQKPIAKTSFGCMGSEAFCTELAALQRKQVILVGIETHICVYQSAQGLLAQGYEVTVLADAVSSRSAENKQIGLDRMKQLGAVISATEMALFELQQEAKGDTFKALAKLIK